MPARRASTNHLTWLLCLACAMMALAGCSLPPLVDREAGYRLDDADVEATLIHQALQPLTARHPGLSGIHPLADPLDAFAARMLLAQTAQASLDVQYYIWHRDTTGLMLLNALEDAADRGVRVRLLLDDNGIRNLDQILSELDNHPNMQVRLFNPFPMRRMKPLGFVTDFRRLNRRMHNKSFTADQRVTIVGGRNVGDEYFGATDSVLFSDLDVVAVGPIVDAMTDDFDRYWNSASAYPIDQVVAPSSAQRAAALERATREHLDPHSASQYLDHLENTAFIRGILSEELEVEWADTFIVSDNPAKVLGDVPDQDLLIGSLLSLGGEPEKTLDLVSPYFVPTQMGVDALASLTRRGVRVRVLTNALESTDVAAVHAGYSKYRKQLLEEGVELWELRLIGAEDAKRPAGLGPFGSSGSSLHAKTFAVDEHHVFVGSFNFDPRSARLNTELGFVISSEKLANDLAQAFDVAMPVRAYRVHLDERGKLYWTTIEDGETVRYDREPGTGAIQRALVKFLTWLPIEGLL